MTAVRHRADEQDIDRKIGRNIACRRSIKGLSQSNLADACGVSFQQVQKYENGANRVSASRLYQIAEVLCCDPGDLFPPMKWEAQDDPTTALDECARLLIQVQPAIDAALRAAKGRPIPPSQEESRP